MKIKKKLQIISFLPFVFTGLVSMVVFYESRQVNQSIVRYETASEISRQAFERAALRDEYILKREERARAQWLLKNEKVERLLADALEIFKSDEEREILEEMHRRNNKIARLFSELAPQNERRRSGTHDEKMNREMDERIFGQMQVETQAVISGSLRLEKKSFNEMSRAQELANRFIVFFIAFLSAVIFIYSYWIGMGISGPLKRLREATDIIAQGNLDHRLELADKDEIGQVAQSFNIMTGKLKEYRDHMEEMVERRTDELQKANERLLQEMAERMEVEKERDRLFNLSIDMLCIAGFDGYFKQLNPAWEKSLGWTNEDLMSKPFIEFVHPDDRQATIGAAEGLASNIKVIDFENRYLCKDGSYKWISWSSFPLVEEKLIFAVARDVSVHKEEEESIKRLNQELAIRASQLENANKELEAFSYSVSHDLRAPLRALTGFSEMLGKRAAGRLDEKNLHYLNVINESAKQMGRLIDDLLSFSRMGRTEMMKTVVSIDRLVKEAVKELEAEVNQRDIVWEFGQMPDVYGDPSMLKLVVVNLISNALKFTRTRSQAKIEIGCAPDGEDEAIFCVRDNGVGFDMQYADKLFGIFQRLHRQDEFEGTGIGLANIKRIIQRHGGRVWAEGKVDEGATFYFTLPKKEAEYERPVKEDPAGRGQPE